MSENEFDPEAELLDEQNGSGTSTDSATEATGEVSTESETAPEATSEVTETDEEKAAREAAEAEKAAADKAKADAELLELYNAFTGTVQTLADSDSIDLTTGTVPDGELANLRRAYLALPAKSRKNAIVYVTEKMQQHLLEGDTNKARAFLYMQKALQSTKQETVVQQPVNPTEAFVELVTAMRLAANFIVVPDGVEADWADKVKALGQEILSSGQADTYMTWLKENEGKPEAERQPEPEVSAVVKRAAQLARGRAKVSVGRKPSSTGTKSSAPRAPRVSDGTRRNIGEHIKQAFDGVASGTFLTVSEIAKFESTEYGTDHPSPGAISARLFPRSGAECKLTFIRPEGTDQGRPQQGAVKL